MVAIASPRPAASVVSLKINGGFVTIDRQDYLYLSKFDWRLHDDGKQKLVYCVSHANLGYPKYIWMHRLLAVRHGILAKGIGHKNGNGLDNRLENLVGAMHHLAV